MFVRFIKAFGETIDWMYSSDPKALEAYVAFRKTTPRNATRLRDEFFPKSALDPNTVKGMDGLMTEAVNLKYMSRVLTPDGARRVRASAVEISAAEITAQEPSKYPFLRAFAGRAGVDRQRVDAAGKLARKCLVDHAVALDPALSAERLRHDMNPEMGLAARPVAGMALVLMRFIHNIEALRRESGGELFGDLGLHLHGTDLCEGGAGGQSAEAARPLGKIICQDLKVSSPTPHNARS